MKERVLALVAEKTGYPVDMLDLDLDLEADFGVDTVKQAELFAAIREAYGISARRKRKLRDYPTLAHVIRLRLRQASGPYRSAQPQHQKLKTAATGACQRSGCQAVPDRRRKRDRQRSVKERILALVVEKTGYPKDMLDLDLDLEADLGVDTVKQAEMFAAIREIYNIPRDREPQTARLSQLWHGHPLRVSKSVPTC